MASDIDFDDEDFLQDIMIQYCDDRGIEMICMNEVPQKKAKRRIKKEAKKENVEVPVESIHTTQIDVEKLAAITKKSLTLMLDDEMLEHLYGNKIRLLKDSNCNIEFLIPKLELTIRDFNGQKKVTAKETMWKEFHTFVSDPDFISTMQSKLDASSDFISWFLFYVQTCLHAEVSKQANAEAEVQVEVATLSSEEKEVICYIAGSIISKLEKKFYRMSKLCTPENRATFDEDIYMLGELKAGDSSNDFNNDLIAVLNRGGLVHPKMQYCEVLFNAEETFRQHSNVTSTNIDAKHILHVCFKSPHVQNNFINLMPESCSNKNAMALLKMVLSLYIKIRCHSHAKQTIEKYRTEIKASFKKKGIRKELQKNKEEEVKAKRSNKKDSKN